MNFIAALLLMSNSAFAAQVTIKVQNVQHPSGAIFINMFNTPASWDAGKPSSVLKILTPLIGQSSLKTNLPPGEYAFFAYHDIDNNGELKQNAFGFPVEPYAFSNNFKLQFSKPPFEKLKFTVTADGTTVHTVELVE